MLPVEDSMEGIFDSIKNAALIHKSGGRTGFSFSRLARRFVGAFGGRGCKRTDKFLKVFNAATEAVNRAEPGEAPTWEYCGSTTRISREFITCKQDNSDITNFNISVGLTGEFMSR